MEHTLHLTRAEIALWDVLPKGLRDGWDVEEEERYCRDSPGRRSRRMQYTRFDDQDLALYFRRCERSGVADTVARYMCGFDILRLNDRDLLEYCYVLGPAVLGKMLEELLRTAELPENIQRIARLSAARHQMFMHFTSAHAQ